MLAEPNRTPYDLNFRLFGFPVRIHPLFWLGAVRVNGSVPIEPEEAGPAFGIENAADRAARTSLDVGEPAEDSTVRVMQDLLRVLYTAWVVGAPLLVDA